MRRGTLTTLASVSESVRYGYTASASTEPCGPKFLRITDIVPPSLDWNSVPYCEASDEERERFSLAVGDVVVARTGATVGYAKMIRDAEESVFASYLVRFRIDPEKAVPAFVGWLIESDLYKRYVKSRVGGAAQPNASAPVLGAFEFRLPPRSTQERIADILSAYDEAMENNRRRMALLEKAARFLYEEWFVRLRFPGREHTKIISGLPQGWQKLPLNAICPDLREAANPSDLEPATPYIGLEHIPRRSITLLEWGGAEDVTSTKLRYKAGDILFGKIRPYFHKVGFALTDGVTSSDAIVLRPTESIYHSFALLTVSSDWFVTIVSKTAKEGSKMPRADWNLMEQHSLLVPPRGILESLNDTVQPILSQLRTLAFQNQKLRAARDILLPRLMSGEVEV